MEKLKTWQMNEFQCVKKVLPRVTEQEGSKTHQSVDLAHYDQGLTFLQQHYSEYIDSVLTCMHNHLKAQQSSEDVDLLNFVVKKQAIELLVTRFSTPLQQANVNIAPTQEEWDDIVSYTKQYINLVTNSYKEVWWKLFNCPDTINWKNILSLVELIFSIPLSNGHLERCFSQLKITKSNR